MSRLITNAIRSTSASADAITMDGSGNVTFPANATCSGTATGFGGGKLLQVQQTVKTDTASTTVASGAFSSTVFLPVNITPASASNKILIMVTANVSDNGTVCIQLTKDGSALDAATGDADGNRRRVTASNYIVGDSYLQSVNATFLDTAGGTSQITYGFKLFCQDNNTTTIYLNRTVNTYNQIYGFRSPSMIQVMEIAA
tara:strand:- start:1162 stop:1761 length:600 start_codon:yes stop_codon:yes gene_type:complete